MLWVKAFHILAVISWMAALLYLPRLFVYHTMTEDTPGKERFQIMERKLYRGIATPAMLATLILGIWLSSYNWAYYAGTGWYWVKLTLVALLVVYHHLCAIYMKQLRQERCQRNHVYFRWFNEFPVLLLIPIVILVVVKPF